MQFDRVTKGLIASAAMSSFDALVKEAGEQRRQGQAAPRPLRILNAPCWAGEGPLFYGPAGSHPRLLSFAT